MASSPVAGTAGRGSRVSRGTLLVGAVLAASTALASGLGSAAHAVSAPQSGPAGAQVLRVSQPIPTFAIRIVPGSDIHLVSKSSKLPISIRNDYNAEIRVQVHVAPANLRALVPASIEVTVPAQTTYVAQVPVTAIADGDVPLRAWLTTFSGLPLGDSVDLNLSVNAEIESSLISGFAIMVAGLGIAGVLRTRAKRRRLRQEQA